MVHSYITLKLLYILILKVAVHTYINRDFNSHSCIRTLSLIVHIDLERLV